MARIFKTPLTVPVDVEVVKKIESIAAAEGKTRLAKLREILDLGLQAYGGQLAKKSAGGRRP
jgi:hypothetical protein